MPIASTVLSLGTPSRGKPIRKTGVSVAAPLMPLNVATPATATQAGNMNR